MIAIIVIAFLALIGALVVVFKQRRSSDTPDDYLLQAPRSEGLFDLTDQAPVDQHSNRAAVKQDLLELARAGELKALSAAHASVERELYEEVVTALLERGSERQENLAALVSHISKSKELRATRQLARRLIETFKSAPDRRSATAMIHIAALSDDAETYEQAIEAALESWRSGRLTGFSPEQLVELFVSQYWILAPEARRGGVGFALKRRLLGIRRELAGTAPNGNIARSEV